MCCIAVEIKNHLNTLTFINFFVFVFNRNYLHLFYQVRIAKFEELERGGGYLATHFYDRGRIRAPAISNQIWLNLPRPPLSSKNT